MSNLPKHVAIIMDGNGRWAAKRHLPRNAGHRQGLKTVQSILEYAAKKGIKVLTLFAFGQENWQRPQKEVSFLMSLFIDSLRKEADKLEQQNVCLQVIGDRSTLRAELLTTIVEVETRLAHNTGMQLVVAFNYSGRWDILQAVKKILYDATQELIPESFDENDFSHYLSTSTLPDPDLLIRTSGEMRVSNFMLWQLAYTEFFFSQKPWPEFNTDDFDQALASFAKRERRFGKTGEQLLQDKHA